MRLFNDAGYAFATINYRLTNIDIEPPAPLYPVHDQDATDAVAAILNISADDMTDEDLQRMEKLIEQARQEGQ